MSFKPHLPADLHERAEFFATALSVFLSRNDKAILPEVLYFLNPDQVLTLINTFGGTSVKIPTMKEFGEDLITTLVIFYHEVRGMSYDEIQRRLDIPQARWEAVMRKTEVWKEFVKDELVLNRDRMKAA